MTSQPSSSVWRNDLEVTWRNANAIVHDPGSGRTYSFPKMTYVILSSLRSQDTPESLLRRLDPSGSPTEQAVRNTELLIAKASAAGLLVTSDVTHGEPETKPAARRFNPLWIEIPLWNPSRIERFTAPVARVLFTRWMFVVWLAMLAATAILVASDRMFFTRFAVFFNFQLWPSVYVLLGLSSLIHEYGHILAAQRFGVKVRRAGFLLYLLMPGAYADVSGAWAIESKHARMLVSAAGVYLESFAAIALLWWGLLGASPVAFVTAACLSTRIVGNLTPFLRLDGYWLLSDWLETPNLRTKAFQLLRELALHPRATVRKHGWRAVAAQGGYAALGVLAMLSALAITLWKVTSWLAGIPLPWAIASVTLGLAVLAVLALRPLRHMPSAS